MGWLLSCSLAFAEGIEVLCATNTLDVRSETLKMDIGSYLPMQHAPLVTSLRWSLDPSFMARGPGDLRGADQLQLLARLLRALPALRRLYFGVDHRSSFWDEYPHHFKRRYQLFTRDVLPLLDDAARAFGGGGRLAATSSDCGINLCVSVMWRKSDDSRAMWLYKYVSPWPLSPAVCLRGFVGALLGLRQQSPTSTARPAWRLSGTRIVSRPLRAQDGV